MEPINGGLEEGDEAAEDGGKNEEELGDEVVEDNDDDVSSDKGNERRPEGVKREEIVVDDDGDDDVGAELIGLSEAGYVEREYRPCLGEAGETLVEERIGKEGTMKFHVPLNFLSRDSYVERAHVKLAQMKIWLKEKEGLGGVEENLCPYSLDDFRSLILDMLEDWGERKEILFKEQTRVRDLNILLCYRSLHVSHGEYAVNKGLHHSQLIIDDLRKILVAVVDLIRVESLDDLGRFII